MITQTIIKGHKFYQSHDDCNLKLSDYCKINYAYNKFLIDKIYDGYHVKLPSELGSLEIVGKKVKPKFSEDGNRITNMSVDWKATWDLRKKDKDFTGVVHYMNSNTDGVRYKFFWHTAKTKMKNQSIYSLKLCRTVKRNLAKLIRKGKRYKIRNNNSINIIST